MGKKTQKWDRVRAKLKQRFSEMGIMACEKCGRTSFLSFAHRLKRRFITDDAELQMVALLCTDNPEGKGCHTKLEHGDHETMFREITRIIEARND